MARYATGTKVPVGQSVQDIRRHLKRFGGEGFIQFEDPDTGNIAIGFRFEGITYKLALDMSDAEEREERRRWRVLEQFIKTLLFGIQEGVGRAEDVLLPYAMLPDGSTMAETFTPQIRELRVSGVMPSFKLALGAGNPDRS